MDNYNSINITPGRRKKRGFSFPQITSTVPMPPVQPPKKEKETFNHKHLNKDIKKKNK